MASGVVRFFDEDHGYGLIAPDDGSNDVIVRSETIKVSEVNEVHKGQRLAFDVVVDKKRCATATGLRALPPGD